MSSNHPKAGPNSVPAYQMSGIPYVTSSASKTEVPNSGGGANVKPIHIKFPYVTKHFTIRNTGASELRLAFSFTGSYDPGATVKGGGTVPVTNDFGRNYFLIPTGSGVGTTGFNGEIQNFDIRCKELYLFGNGGTTGFSLIAGLTTISESEFPIFTGSVEGSTGFEGVG
jgi:hypothetical protein